PREREPSELRVGDVPADVTLRERGDDSFHESAVLEAVLAKLPLVLRADVDFELAVAVEVGEDHGLLEARRLAVDEGFLPPLGTPLEEPQARGQPSRDEVPLAVAVDVPRRDGPHLAIGNAGHLGARPRTVLHPVLLDGHGPDDLAARADRSLP